jgi:hypothetical protein
MLNFNIQYPCLAQLLNLKDLSRLGKLVQDYLLWPNQQPAHYYKYKPWNFHGRKG